jgi:hypothetical protein
MRRRNFLKSLCAVPVVGLLSKDKAVRGSSVTSSTCPTLKEFPDGRKFRYCRASSAEGWIQTSVIFERKNNAM